VLKRVQVLGALRMRFFQDVICLAPGERWWQMVCQRIDSCDLFLLF
jgi:hypothetical protein